MKNKPLLFLESAKIEDWDDWLKEAESKLSVLNYRKYNQKLNGEDFCYWKTFYNGEDKIYQIGFRFYDFRKYDIKHGISLMCICMLLGDERIDLEVSKDCTLQEFQQMCETFYKAMNKYC